MHPFHLGETLLTILGVLTIVPAVCGFLIYVERKIAAYVQDRIGPNRVGPAGLLQSVADGLKFLFKEDIIPQQVDKLLYVLAPALSLSTALLAFAVVPFGPTEAPPHPPLPPLPGAAAPDYDRYQQQLAHYKEQLAAYRRSYQAVVAPGLDIGLLFVFAAASLNVYGIILGGWASNNKYSLLGGLRSSAQIISYEIPLGLSILGVILLSGSLNLEEIIQEQVQPSTSRPAVWNICFQPLGFLLFLVSSFAETNRLPFDLPEAEQELVGGFHTEYSALKFTMFFLGEYTSVITTSFIMVIAFFGGWHFPGIAEADSPWLIRSLVFIVKMTFFIFFFMWVRWTLPRFRFDQLMSLAWKGLTPLALANLLCVLVVKEWKLSLWWLLPASVLLFVLAAAFSAWASPEPQRRQAALPATSA
jgi:NADH-quinone oxidoreductase subunit H